MTESNPTGGHANESFRFVQLSDLHLSSIVRPSPWQLANKRLLGYLSWLRRRRHTHQRWVLDIAIDQIRQLKVDHLAITGDMTHIGLKDEFEQVYQWLRNVALINEVTLIPGNHDLYVDTLWDRSFSFWEKYMLGDNQEKPEAPHQASKQLNLLYPIVRIRKHIAFIGISSVFNAPWFRATGRVNEQQLDRLKALLCGKTLDDYCKVLLIHHPLTVTHTPLRKCLLNREALVDILQQHPVDLVLHGHGHNSCYETIDAHNHKKIPVIGASSSSSISQSENYKAEFLLFNIAQKEHSWKIQKQNYILDIQQKNFIAATCQELT